MLLRKKIYQISLTAIFIIGSLFITNIALADDPPNPSTDDLIVNFNPDDPSSDKLFDVDNFLPGDSASGSVYVKNNSGEKKRIAVQAINVVDSDEFSNALNMEIKKDNITIYNQSLSNFLDNEIYLLDLENENSTDYDFIVNFWNGSNNNFQGKTLNFDILIGFQGKDGGISPGASSGGGSFHGLIIKNESAVVTNANFVEIEWWTSYKATSQVVYCKSTENCSLDLSNNTGGPPLYGYNYTTGEEHTPANQNGVTYRKIKITGLQPETTYDYRCISHASPPTISRTHTFTTLALAKSGEKSKPLNNPVENVYNENKPAAENGPVPVAQEQNIEENADNKKSGKNIIAKSLQKMASSAQNIAGSVLGEQNFLNNNTSNSKNQINSGITDKSQNESDYQSKHYTTAFFIILLLIILAVLFCFFRKRQKED